MIFDKTETVMFADPAYRKVMFAKKLPLVLGIVVVISFLHGRDAVSKGESIAPVLIAGVFITGILVATMYYASNQWHVVRHADGSLELKGMGLSSRKLGRPGTQVRCKPAGEKWEIVEAYSGILILKLPKAAFPQLDRMFEPVTP